MSGRPPFGVRLWRLLAVRRPSFEASIQRMIAELARDAGAAGSDLHAVIQGSQPDSDIVRRLAPTLGIHTADMFVIAGLPVPNDEASAWPTRP